MKLIIEGPERRVAKIAKISRAFKVSVTAEYSEGEGASSAAPKKKTGGKKSNKKPKEETE